MTERDPGAERDPDESGVPDESTASGGSTAPGEGGAARDSEGAPAGDGRGGERREPSLPADEEAAWEAIVAAYGDEPADEPTEDPAFSLEKSDPSSETPEPDGDTLTKPRQTPDEGGGDAGGEPPVRSLTVYAAGTGPRDWDGPEEDEGHFEPPEPPPLPETDTTTKFAWIAVLGGPLLLIGAILFQFDLTWWIVTLGVGGFMGGFATLVARMRDERDGDDWDDPGRGAVV